MLTKILPQMILGVILSLSYGTSVLAQLGIGTTTPHSSAMLDISSSEQGLLPPRMTNQERDSINGGVPAEGLVIYNTDEKCLQHWNGSEWKCTSADASGSNTGDVITVKTVSKDKPHVFAFDDYKTFTRYPALLDITFYLIDVDWVSSDEFFVAGVITSCINSNSKDCYYKFRVSHYNKNFGKTREFEVDLNRTGTPIGGSSIGSSFNPTPLVTRLVNGDFAALYASHECRDSRSFPKCYNIKIIDSNTGNIKSSIEKQELTPWAPKSWVDGHAVTTRPFAISALDNGNFLLQLSYDEFNNNHVNYVSIIFDGNGNIIKSNRDLRSQHGSVFRWMPTDFGYATISREYNASSMFYATYNFNGDLINKTNIPSSNELYADIVAEHVGVVVGKNFFIRAKDKSNDYYFVAPEKIKEVSMTDTDFSIGSEKIISSENKVSFNHTLWYTIYSRPFGEKNKGDFIYLKDLKQSNAGRKIPVGTFSDGSPFMEEVANFDIASHLNSESTEKIIKSVTFSPGVRASDRHYSTTNNLNMDQNNFLDYMEVDDHDQYTGLVISPDGNKMITIIPLEGGGGGKMVVSAFDISDLNEISQFLFVAKSNSVKQHVGKRFFLSSSEDSLKEVKVQISDGYQSGDTLESNCSSSAVACTSLGQFLVIAGANTGSKAPLQDFTQALNEMTFKTNSGAGKRVIEITATTANGIVGDTVKFTLNVSD